MTWNLVPECISTIVLSIIWIYSRKGNLSPSLKNKLFQLCFLITFLAMTSNILSTILLYQLNTWTYLPAWIINTIYFIATPLMGMFYYFYAFANLYEGQIPRRLFLVSTLPGILYIIAILINPWTKLIYDINLSTGYQQGSMIMFTYLIFYLYCIFCVLLVIRKGRQVPKTIRRILFTFPLIAALVIVVQLFYPSIILSGSAATISLLMIYLYLQNKQISIDYLTKTPNRQEFLNILSIDLNKNKKNPFTLIVLSLRDFKRVNDIYGQRTGDELLIALRNYLIATFHLKENQLFRYSGDEFAILIQKLEETELVEMISNIYNRFKEPWQTTSGSSMLNIAIGIVEYPKCADSMETLINGIEFSINLAKNNTQDHYVCRCTPDILNRVKRRQQITDILKNGIINHSFEVYYQPIYSIKQQCFVSAEALLRIPQSSIGPIYPDEFIPIAEESGIIIDITYHVLDMVCATMRQALDMELQINGIGLNFSALQFTRYDLMDNMMEIMKRHQISGNYLNVEITEGTVSENSELMKEFASAMRNQGIRIALDDFGTGYSNTSSVLTYPVDTIKLDKSLIWTAIENERSTILVKNLVNAFKELGYTVLAEGVETNQQRIFVEACGCDLIQGFYYAKPMPKDEFLTFIQMSQKQVNHA